MSRQIQVITPENIPITLELAGLGTRFGAFLVDFFIQVVTVIALSLLTLILTLVAATVTTPLAPFFPAIAILGSFSTMFGYFMVFEALWNGQTPGKRLFGLRVVRDGGYPIGFFAATARNLVRIADFLPIFYGVGSLSLFFSPEHKRLGDFVAGTIVIKEHTPPSIQFINKKDLQRFGAAVWPENGRHPADELNTDEIALLRRFAIRRWQMTSDDSERLAYRLMVPLVERLEIRFDSNSAPRYADLLSTIVAVTDKRLHERENQQ